MRTAHLTRRRLTMFVITAVLIVGAFAVPALAQNTSEVTSESSSENNSTDTATPSGRFADHQTALAEALAAELDLPVERVTSALESSRAKLAAQRDEQRAAAIQERLDAAVDAGALTQEQADAIAAAVESGAIGGRGFGGDESDGWGFGGHGRGKGHYRGMPDGMLDDVPADGTGGGAATGSGA